MLNINATSEDKSISTNTEVMSLKEKYSRLKENICQQAMRQPFSIQKVKDFYKASINSNRQLSKAKNLKCVFKLLEERCLLDEKNITALYCLGELLGNTGITDYISVYVKYSKELKTTCDHCGLSCDYKEMYSSSVQEGDISDQRNDTDFNSTDDLEEKLRNLTFRIGKKWKVLARHLELKEKCIDEICERFPNDLFCQAKTAFEILRASAETNISVPVLETALNARYCRLKGLSPCLLEPVFSLSS